MQRVGIESLKARQLNIGIGNDFLTGGLSLCKKKSVSTHYGKFQLTQ